MQVTPVLFLLVVYLLVQAQGCTPECQNGASCVDGSCACDFSKYGGDACEGIVIDITLADDEVTIEEGEGGSFSFFRQVKTPALDVNYTFTGTFDGSDTDLTSLSGTLHFPDNDRHELISFIVGDDTDNEIAETMIVTLTQGTYVLTKTLTISPSDPINVSVNTTKSEEDGFFTATCNFPSAGSLTFNVTVDGGSAETTNDYTSEEPPATCSSTDSGPVNLPYRIVDDDIPELQEDIEFSFTFPPSAYVNVLENTVDINDNDAIDITVTLPNPLPESYGTPLLKDFITVDVGTASGGDTFPLTIKFEAIAGATAGLDFIASQTFTMMYDPENADASFQGETLSITDDMDDEPNTEGIKITFDSEYDISGDTVVTLSITDNDDPTVEILVGPGNLESESPRTITLTRSSTFDELTLAVSATSGTASSGDYTFTDTSVTFPTGTAVETITVTIVDDDIVENDEAFSLTFVGSSTTVDFVSSDVVVIPITNDDEDYFVSTRLHRDATDVTDLNEEDGYLNISLSRISSVGTLPVNVTVTSTDATGDDFTFVLPTLEFQDGDTEIDSFSVQILDDGIPEPTETLGVTTSWQTFSETALISILDTDPFNVTISGSDSVAEEDGFYNYTLTRKTDYKSLTVGIMYVTDPGSSDFSEIAYAMATFQMNELTADVSVQLSDDDDREQDDFVTIQIVGNDHDIVGQPVTFNLTVVNSDLDNVTATAVDTLEDNGFITVSVTREAIFETLYVNISAGSCSGPRCVSDDDYTLPTPSTLMFPAGQDNMLVNINITIDTDHEAHEILVLDFTPEADKAAPTSLTVRILNDDPETVTLPLLVGAFEDEGEISVELTRTLDLDPFTVNITTVDGTAFAGVDFLQLSLEPVMFVAGSLKAYVDINITDNTVDDPDRIFQIQVTGNILEVPDKDVHIFDDEGGRPFNCLRNGQNCTEEGDVCTTLPICYCSNTNRSGDQCNVLTNNVISCTPGDKCSGNGVCTNVDNACICDDGYYGDACEHYFLHNICNISSMVVIINPVGFFDGEMYVYRYSDVEECRFKPLDELEPGVITDDTLKGYGLVMDHVNSSCGDIVPVENGDITSYTRGILVAYTKSIQMSIDQYVRAICSFNNSNFELLIANVTIVEDSDAFVQENVQNLASPVIIEAFADSTILTTDSVVNLDSDVNFRLSVPEPFQGLAVRDIWLENGLTGNDTQVFWLYEDGCVVPAASGILGPIRYESEGSVINKAALTFEYSAIAFDSSDRVVTYVTLRICVNSTDCDVPCESTTSVTKRATSGDTTVWTVFKVDAVNYHPGSNKDSVISSSGPISGPAILEEQSGAVQFVPTIAGLGVAAAILILICCIVLFVLLRRRRKPLKKGY